MLCLHEADGLLEPHDVEPVVSVVDGVVDRGALRVIGLGLGLGFEGVERGALCVRGCTAREAHLVRGEA